jgi:tRNA/rRNA methyltransferase
MNLPQTNTSVFQRLRFILVDTSHPGNIGAVARAMKTMGFNDLVLVNPRFPDALSHPDAIAFASGALDVLQNAKIVAHIDEALHGCHFTAAVSARLREFSPPIQTPREFAERVQTSSDAQFAVIFGSERYGLPNEIVVNCNVLINIPANPDYSSLNLAQAVQIVAYEARVQDSPQNAQQIQIGFQGALASSAEVDGMYSHLEEALISIGFLDANNPRKLMPRIKRMLARTELEQEEVNILRGIARKILSAPKNS